MTAEARVRWPGRPAGEALMVFAVFMALAKLHELTPLSLLQARGLGWNFNAHILMIMLPGLAALAARRGPAGVGLTRPGPAAVPLCAVPIATLALVWTVLEALPAVLAGKHLVPVMPPHPFPASRTILGPVLTVIFTAGFCGVGEEIMFRGYMQNRMNDAWGRPFKIMGVPFGWGLVVSAVIFGLGHGVPSWNPFGPDPLRFNFMAGAAAATFGQGLLFGLIYERTNSILTPAALHAAIGVLFASITFG